MPKFELHIGMCKIESWEVLDVAEFREILRLNSLGLSGRSIAGSVSCSRNTVAEVLARAKKLELEWPLPLDITDEELKKILFPEKEKVASVRIPDCEQIHRNCQNLE